MDELIDILDADGNFTGRTAMKSEAHRNGWFHQTIHLWFYTKDGRLLIQQRAKNKDTHPLYWDVSVAGHIGAGESVESSVVREASEEIGVNISEIDLHKIGTFKSVHRHHDNLIDCEYHHTFLCELKVPLQDLKKQESEVAALALIPLIQFSEETWGLAKPGKYVPYETDYYKIIAKAVKERL